MQAARHCKSPRAAWSGGRRANKASRSTACHRQRLTSPSIAVLFVSWSAAAKQDARRSRRGLSGRIPTRAAEAARTASCPWPLPLQHHPYGPAAVGHPPRRCAVVDQGPSGDDDALDALEEAHVDHHADDGGGVGWVDRLRWQIRPIKRDDGHSSKEVEHGEACDQAPGDRHDVVRDRLGSLLVVPLAREGHLPDGILAEAPQQVVDAVDGPG
eukprot:CAMPEP_0176301298 /NCGR_PEP_ID=MMETSP0121_2-20121125/60781_1 /TAXON_ID=160619 /ORGANISM="Kryptoperidinium foliaceum, Strain CCMP 1326" /LENGTH=212 /DNA_ID=CAMNT_0017642745 /DNA_START=143 /DNA_END=777 /DNA_ORIENTATION=-